MSKLVSLSDRAYGILRKMKKGNESFSDVVVKMADNTRKKSILRYAGLWKDDKETDKVFRRVLKERHKAAYKEKDVSW